MITAAIVGVFVGAFLGVFLMSLFSVNVYEKGYQDGMTQKIKKENDTE